MLISILHVWMLTAFVCLGWVWCFSLVSTHSIFYPTLSKLGDTLPCSSRYTLQAFPTSTSRITCPFWVECLAGCFGGPACVSPRVVCTIRLGWLIGISAVLCHLCGWLIGIAGVLSLVWNVSWLDLLWDSLQFWGLVLLLALRVFFYKKHVWAILACCDSTVRPSLWIIGGYQDALRGLLLSLVSLGLV